MSYARSMSNLQRDYGNMTRDLQNNNNNVAKWKAEEPTLLETIAKFAPTARELYLKQREATIKAQTTDLAVQLYREKKYNPEAVNAITETKKAAHDTSVGINTEMAAMRKSGQYSPEFINNLKNADPAAVEKIAQLILSQKLGTYESWMQNQMLNSTERIQIPGTDQSIQINEIGSTPLVGSQEMQMRMAAADALQRKWFEENGMAGFTSDWLYEQGAYDKLEKSDANLYKTWSAQADINQGARDRSLAARAFYDNPTGKNLLDYVSTAAGSVDTKNKPIGWERAWGSDYFEKIVTDTFLSGKPVDLVAIGNTELPKHLQTDKIKTLRDKWPRKFAAGGTLERTLQSAMNEKAEIIRKGRTDRHTIASDTLEQVAIKALNAGNSVDQLLADPQFKEGLKLVREKGKLAGIENPTKNIDAILESFGKGDRYTKEVAQTLFQLQNNKLKNNKINVDDLSEATKLQPEIAKAIETQKSIEDSENYKSGLGNLEQLFTSKLEYGVTRDVSGAVTGYSLQTQKGWDYLENNFYGQVKDFVEANNGTLPTRTQMQQMAQQTQQWAVSEGINQDNEDGLFFFDTNTNPQSGLVNGFSKIEKRIGELPTLTDSTAGFNRRKVNNLKNNFLIHKRTHGTTWPDYIKQGGGILGIQPTHIVNGEGVYDWNTWIEQNPGQIHGNVRQVVEASGGKVSVFDVLRATQTEGTFNEDLIPENARELDQSLVLLPGYLSDKLRLAQVGGTPLTLSDDRAIRTGLTIELGINRVAEFTSDGRLRLEEMKTDSALVDPWINYAAGIIGVTPEELKNDIDPNNLDVLDGAIGDFFLNVPEEVRGEILADLSIYDHRFGHPLLRDQAYIEHFLKPTT